MFLGWNYFSCLHGNNKSSIEGEILVNIFPQIFAPETRLAGHPCSVPRIIKLNNFVRRKCSYICHLLVKTAHIFLKNNRLLFVMSLRSVFCWVGTGKHCSDYVFYLWFLLSTVHTSIRGHNYVSNSDYVWWLLRCRNGDVWKQEWRAVLVKTSRAHVRTDLLWFSLRNYTTSMRTLPSAPLAQNGLQPGVEKVMFLKKLNVLSHSGPWIHPPPPHLSCSPSFHSLYQ